MNYLIWSFSYWRWNCVFILSQWIFMTTMTWLKRRYADSHSCWFRMIFGWKAMYHYTCQESTFLIAFAWSFAIFACIKNCLHLTAWCHFSCMQNHKTMRCQFPRSLWSQYSCCLIATQVLLSLHIFKVWVKNFQHKNCFISVYKYSANNMAIGKEKILTINLLIICRLNFDKNTTNSTFLCV